MNSVHKKPGTNHQQLDTGDRELQRATHVIGMTVRNFRNEKLGVITDLAFDLESARLIFVTVSPPGFFQIGRTSKAVPPIALLQHTDNASVVMQMDTAEFAAAPTVSHPISAGSVDRSDIENVYRYYRSSLQYPAGQQIIQLMLANNTIGRPVRNAKSETLGHLRDLALELVNGRILYAVMSVDGSGRPAKLVAIPPGALSTRRAEAFLFNTDKTRLQRAQSFTDSHWPSLENAVWGSGLYQYFDCAPSWNEESARENEGPDHRFVPHSTRSTDSPGREP